MDNFWIKELKKAGLDSYSQNYPHFPQAVDKEYVDNLSKKEQMFCRILIKLSKERGK